MRSKPAFNYNMVGEKKEGRTGGESGLDASSCLKLGRGDSRVGEEQEKH
jgi:hypothetical protein